MIWGYMGKGTSPNHCPFLWRTQWLQVFFGASEHLLQVYLFGLTCKGVEWGCESHVWLPYIHDLRGIFLQVAPATGDFTWLLSCFGCFFSEDPWHCGSLLLKPSWQRTWAVFGPHRKTSPAFEIWSVILYLIHSHDIHWYTVIFYHSDKDTDPHSVVNIDQLTAIWEMLLVTTLSFVWGHEINNMMSQCIYSPPQIKTGVSDDATGDPASSTSMCGPRKNSQIVIERKCSSRVFHDFYWIKILY